MAVTDFINESKDCGKAIQTRAFRFNGSSSGYFAGSWGMADNNDVVQLQCPEKKESWHALEDGVCPGEKYTAKSAWTCEQDSKARLLLFYVEHEDVSEKDGTVLIETMFAKIKTLTNFFGITNELGL